MLASLTGSWGFLPTPQGVEIIQCLGGCHMSWGVKPPNPPATQALHYSTRLV